MYVVRKVSNLTRELLDPLFEASYPIMVLRTYPFEDMPELAGQTKGVRKGFIYRTMRHHARDELAFTVSEEATGRILVVDTGTIREGVFTGSLALYQPDTGGSRAYIHTDEYRQAYRRFVKRLGATKVRNLAYEKGLTREELQSKYFSQESPERVFVRKSFASGVEVAIEYGI